MSWKLELIIFALALSAFTFKLSDPYFFTDEILYTNAGREYILKRDYTLNLQHPFIAKYLAGGASLLGEKNVFLIRLPFALLGALTTLLAFKIAKEALKDPIGGIFASSIYIGYPYLFTTTRMAMLEAPMHFFWLCSSYFFIRYLKVGTQDKLYYTSVFLGLAIASKATSSVLGIAYFVVLLLDYKSTGGKKLLRQLCLMLVITFSVVLVSYADFIYIRGFEALIHIPRAIKDTILDRNIDGKLVVVGSTLYSKSPWWFYLYELKNKYSVLLAGLSILSICYSIKSYYRTSSKYEGFWLILLGLTLFLAQSLTLKNARYISSIELPLVFITTSFLYTLYRAKYKLLPVAILLVVLGTQGYYLLKLKPTGYNGAYRYLTEQTRNFSTSDRILIFGSTRTSKWYFEGTPKDLVVIRKEPLVSREAMKEFKYIMVDEIEQQKDPQKALFTFLASNTENYSVTRFDNVFIYTNLRQQK